MYICASVCGGVVCVCNGLKLYVLTQCPKKTPKPLCDYVKNLGQKN